jgi:lipoprotein NlpD
MAGCATKAPAPVSERTRPGSTQGKPDASASAQPSPVARPGYYIVKPGDTLIRIALDHGQNYRDIAAWSGLENANLIEVGQELRVRPPESGAVSRPVSSSGVEVRPVAAAGSAPAAVSSDGVRREPKGGKVAYSEQAWAQAQKPEAPVVLAKVDPKPEAKPETKAETKAETKPEPVKPEAKEEKKAEPAKAANGDDKIDWAWPASGKIIAGFNETSSKGVDLSGKPGDPVLAAASGRVVYAGTGLRGYGKLVIVKHDNSYLSAYAHNQNLLVKEGQAVSRGQKIAELGDTDSDRPKLHFEIRRQGKPVDPGKYLPPR